ncbi:MAG TPA: ParB/RepB/Spo0J family partition protein [Acidobacteriota bacterium]
MTRDVLKEIEVDLIDRNPENPRIIFRTGELSQLTESIRKHGVQVPIAVYREGRRFVLIDGERRWRCSIKLNRPTIPALVQDKPDRLSNLLLMFNIHALREQWDLLTIAMKLPIVIGLLRTRNNREPTEREISSETGLIAGVVRRCKLLMALPEKHKQTILKELQKPKPEQKFTEDFFIEMERSLTTVERAMPALVKHLGKERMRETLISKFKAGTISNRVDFRQIARIARAERVSADPVKATKSLEKLFSDNKYSIEDAYESSVAYAYDERGVLTRVRGLTVQLNQFESETVDEELQQALEELQTIIANVLGG